MKRNGKELVMQARLYPRLVRSMIDFCCIRAKTIGYVRGYDLHDMTMRYFHGVRHSDSYDTERLIDAFVKIGFMKRSHHSPSPDQLAFAGLSYSKSGYRQLIDSSFEETAGVKTHFAYSVDLGHPMLKRLGYG